jgi:hypothetical protein
VRRGVLILILVGVVVFAGFMLLRPKNSARPSRAKAGTSSDSAGTGTQKTAAVTSRKPAKPGKTTGRLKARTKEERKVEMKRIREEERKRKRELKRQERERRRMLKQAGSRRGRKRGRRGEYYVVKAIVSLGSDSYALIDGRRAKPGDVVMGRRIVAIEPDRIEIEAFGRRSTVRVGESLLPPTYSPPRGRR